MNLFKLQTNHLNWSPLGWLSMYQLNFLPLIHKPPVLYCCVFGCTCESPCFHPLSLANLSWLPNPRSMHPTPMHLPWSWQGVNPASLAIPTWSRKNHWSHPRRRDHLPNFQLQRVGVGMHLQHTWLTWWWKFGKEDGNSGYFIKWQWTYQWTYQWVFMHM